MTLILVKKRDKFFLAAKTTRALCLAGVLGNGVEEVRQAAVRGDAFAQSWMTKHTGGEERFRWTGKSAAQGERDGFYWSGHFYRYGIGCEEDAKRAKENFLVAAELGCLHAMDRLGELLDKDDPQRCVWFGRAASSDGASAPFLNEMGDQIRNFSSGTRNAKVVFVIGRALKGQIDNEKGTLFGHVWNFDTIGLANRSLRFYEFQLRCYRKQWTVGRLLH
jgi:hypothetical protein